MEGRRPRGAGRGDDLMNGDEQDDEDGYAEDVRLDDDAGPSPGAGPDAGPDAAPAWLTDLRRSPHRRGFYQSEDAFAVMFADRGSDTLVVTFDNLSSARDDAVNRDPWGYGFVAGNGWSNLGAVSYTHLTLPTICSV